MATAVLFAMVLAVLGRGACGHGAVTPAVTWDGENMKMTHYWDCNGQGCDAATLLHYSDEKYISPPGYGPQDPADFPGGAIYGEAMWLTGAASDALSALMGEDDGCCGHDLNDGGVGGCGKCLLVQNSDSLHPDWTAVVMKKNRCPPWSNGCGAGEPHFDVAAPGFDNLQWSTANVCGIRPGTGFESQEQSEAVGSWWDHCDNTADCAHLCEQLPATFQKGCKLFASWGWKHGNFGSVKYRTVICPAEFVAHVGKQFGPDGATVVGVPTPGPTTQMTTTSAVTTTTVTASLTAATTTATPEVTTTEPDGSQCGQSQDCTHPWGLSTIFTLECLSGGLGCNAMGLVCCRYCEFGVFEDIACSDSGAVTTTGASTRLLRGGKN